MTGSPNGANRAVMNTKIPIEDEFEDILGKAMAGNRLFDRKLSAETGVHIDTIRALVKGQLDEMALPKLAPALKLDPNSLLRSAMKSWRPRPVELDGLLLFNSDYHGRMTVNAFLIWDPKSKAAAVFDTGTDAFPIMDAISERGLQPVGLFLTHTHPDHIAEADSLTNRLGIPAFSNAKEPYENSTTFEAGAEFEIGGLKVETRTTWGHSIGGTTFVIHGLERPVAIVGDAMFAGSIGGGLVSYDDALKTNREQILTLPDETVLCPGHGPLTSVGEEKRNNPFFPEFK
jgi:hydroxyacylglutathione hydrolase